MATYKSMEDFQKKFCLTRIQSRTAFLHHVKWASLERTDPYPNHTSLKGILFAMHADLLPQDYTCEVCAGSFRLRLRLGQDRQSWDWVSRKKSCDQCTNTSRSLTSGTTLQGVKAKHFLTFFDCMCMWSFDYPSWIIIREAGIWHQQLNQWEEVFHQAVKADLWHHATSYSITSTSLKSANQIRKLPPKKVLSKKPARQVWKTAMKKQHAIKKLSSKVHAPCKRPATCSKFHPRSQKKVPDAMSFYKKYKYVVGVDESHLNKLRSGALSKSSRAGPDQVWVWGATVPRRPDRFLFRVLEHP